MGSSWQERTALVTGATGIIGSFLVEALLSRGAGVVALIRDAEPSSELYRSGNIHKVATVDGALEDFACVERAINEHEADTVFHLGAQTIVGAAQRSPLATFEANIRGTYNVLDACRIHSGLVDRLVVASSDKAYGKQQRLPYTEDLPMEGRHPYEVSKSCADLLARSYAHAFGLPVAVARCGNVYGGGDLNWSRIVPGTIRSLLKGEKPVIRSDGKYTRDYVYVKDVTSAYISLAEKLDGGDARGEAFNFSTGKPLSVLEIVDAIGRTMQLEDLEPEILDCTEGEIRDQYLDAGKARELLGWRPEYTLEEGLEETVAWYERFFESHGAA